MIKTKPERISWIESKVCSYIAEEKKITNLDAFRLFLSSKTHQLLLDDQMKLWYFSPEALFEIYKTEEETGDPRDSAYLKGE